MHFSTAVVGTAKQETARSGEWARNLKEIVGVTESKKVPLLALLLYGR